MSLKSLAMKNLSNQIINTPPIIQEEIIYTTIEQIKQNVKSEAIAELTTQITNITQQTIKDMLIHKKNVHEIITNHISDNSCIDSKLLIQIINKTAETVYEIENEILNERYTECTECTDY